MSSTLWAALAKYGAHPKRCRDGCLLWSMGTTRETWPIPDRLNSGIAPKSKIRGAIHVSDQAAASYVFRLSPAYSHSTDMMIALSLTPTHGCQILQSHKIHVPVPYESNSTSMHFSWRSRAQCTRLLYLWWSTITSKYKWLLVCGITEGYWQCCGLLSFPLSLIRFPLAAIGLDLHILRHPELVAPQHRVRSAFPVLNISLLIIRLSPWLIRPFRPL